MGGDIAGKWKGKGVPYGHSWAGEGGAPPICAAPEKCPFPPSFLGGHYEWEKEEGKGEKEQKGKRKEGTP